MRGLCDRWNSLLDQIPNQMLQALGWLKRCPARLAALLAAALVLPACAVATAYVVQVYAELPANPQIRWNLASVVLDRRGNEVMRLHAGEDRTFVPLSRVPAHAVNAVIAMEDARFWRHSGVDLYRLAGAGWHDLLVWRRGKGDLQGGSTITQQLVKNAFLTPERSLRRKVKEALLALRLEQQLDKRQILEQYLNQIYLGQSYYGISAAARGYFGKEPEHLTLGEAALLAGVIQSPSRYNPVVNPDGALARRRTVLDQMAAHGLISPETKELAAAEPLGLAAGTGDGPEAAGVHAGGAPGNYFTDYVVRVLTDPQLARRQGLAEPLAPEALFSGGYRIETTFDPELQALAEQAVAQVMDPAADPAFALPAGRPEQWLQAAMVAMEPDTGAVRALVGGRRRSAMRELNRATDTLRQPGSTFKPIAAYLPAMELLGLAPGSVVDDTPFSYEKSIDGMWPANYDRRYRGLTPLRAGISRSVNAMAVRLASMAGSEQSLAYARKLGITSLIGEGEPNDTGLATALGGLTRGVSLLELTGAYATIANLGVPVEPRVITRITDRDGQVIFAAGAGSPPGQPVIRPAVAWLMIDMLKDVVRRGTARRGAADLAQWAVAGKTGTTEQNHDAWFVGFSRRLVVGVWNGYDTPAPLPYTGGGAPVSIWAGIMAGAHPEPPPDWERPEGLVQVTVCTKTGLLPGRLCPETSSDWFEAGHEPRRRDDGMWTRLPVVPDGNGSWRLWRLGCLGLPSYRVFLQRPDFPRHPTRPGDPRWIPEDAAMTPPTEYCDLSRWWGRDRDESDRWTPWNPPKKGKGKGRGG